MIDGLLLSKIGVSVATVMGLSLITERLSPRVAGLLSGFPLGTAIALFFIGYENGGTFAAEGAVYTLAGLAATLTLAAGFYLGSRIAAGRLGTAASGLTALVGFFGACALLREMPLTLQTAIISPLLAIAFYATLFRRIENRKVTNRIRLTHWVLLARAGLATLVVLAVTGTASFIGPEWAGLFSAFPSTVFPLLLIIHWSYGNTPVHTIVKNYPNGMGALVVYSISVSLTYATFGVVAGTALSFVSAFAYLGIYTAISTYRARRKAAQPAE